jgi:hypothetical protein
MMGLVHFWIGGMIATSAWAAFKVPPRTAVEVAVTVAAALLWPALFAYALYVRCGRPTGDAPDIHP